MNLNKKEYVLQQRCFFNVQQQQRKEETKLIKIWCRLFSYLFEVSGRSLNTKSLLFV